MDGVVVVNKDAGWTSHDVVGKMRRIAGTKRIGHLGTLDPGATGVLPLVLGKATRLAQFFTRAEKVYEATIRFGFSTDTYDAEGQAAGEIREFIPAVESIEPHLVAFRGTFSQTPPPVSAKKVGGTPAYKLARKNVAFELTPVEVTVHALELLGCEGDLAHLRVHCSGGTYVRAIAHDLGQAIGCGAHLAKLRRMRSGDFTIDQARTLNELETLARDARLDEALVPASHLLPEFPTESVDDLTAGQIRQGRDFRVSPFRSNKGAKYVKALDSGGALLAIGEMKLPNLYHPMLVL